MRTLLVGVTLSVLLGAGLLGAWLAMNYFNPGSVGTPAHAGAVSNGRPEECTNVNFSVPARGQTQRTVLLEDNWLLVRGTFEANGGFGRVDLLMRIVSPQGLEILASPKATNYDFSLPVQIRGDYVFVFDNRYSLYTSKSAALFYCIDKGLPR